MKTNQNITTRGREGINAVKEATNTAFVTTKIMAEKASDSLHDIKLRTENAKNKLKKLSNYFK